MKKFCLIFLIGAIVLSLLAGCEVSEPAKVDREIVEAVVVNSGHGRGGDWIQVAYDGVITSWSNADLYKYYHTRHGATIKSILVTYTYESGRIKQKLLYNEDIENRNGGTEVK
jgi:hypothetical protein